MIEVNDAFHKIAFGQIIPPLTRLYVSFDKELKMGGFFTLDKSILDGSDILKAAAVDNPAQNWDFYQYKDFTDRLVSMNWERSLEFPYQIQCAMADFTLDNTDEYFTPLNPNSSIGEYNLPARPFRMYAGFGGNVEIIPQLVGITQNMPDLNNGSKTIDYHGIDFLYDICNQQLNNVIDLRGVTTD